MFFKKKTGAEGTPESANPSVVDEEEEEFPSLPYGVDIFTPEANGFEMLNGDFFDSLDLDGSKLLSCLFVMMYLVYIYIWLIDLIVFRSL